MNKEFSPIREPVHSDYLSLPKDRRLSYLSNANVLISTRDLSNQRLIETVNEMNEKGIPVLSIAHVAAAVSEKARLDGLDIPMYDRKVHASEGKVVGMKVLANQKIFFSEIVSNMRFLPDQNNTGFRIIVDEEDEEINLMDNVIDALNNSDPVITKILENNIYLSGCRGILKAVLDSNNGIIAIDDHALIYSNAINIAIGNEFNSQNAFKGKKYNDKVIDSSNPEIQVFGILREVTKQVSHVRRREKLQTQIQQGEIKLLPNFKREQWPTHPLMNYLKLVSIPLIEDEVRNAGLICDSQDIRYQTLFRLTTIPVTQIFHEGDKLQNYLLDQGIFTDWKKIPNLSQVDFEDYPVQESTIRDVIKEQLHIIDNRLSMSNLPIAEIIKPSGIFAERGWEIVKEDNNVFAFNRNSNRTVPLEFKEVEPSLAVEFHNDLHYIHSPRADYAFAFFIKGEEIPFSILSAENLDRDYKKNILLSYGYDPDNCLDFTRLYSRPGTPLNTSTAIMGSVYDYIRQYHPSIQAGVSSFMPTYASGLSMVSGGFEKPVLVKTGKHKFQKKVVNNKEVWEHVTTRRQLKDETTIESTFPMLPTIELLLALRRPRYEPILGVQGKMFDMTE